MDKSEITPEYVDTFQKHILSLMEQLLRTIQDYEFEIGKTRGTSIIVTDLEKLIAGYKYFMMR